MKIIIQAGGRGSRLEGLTRNKPKCLVSVNNLPIIFHAFHKFPQADFTIIADYRTEVLERYLSIYAKGYRYRILRARAKGTISGIADAIEAFTDDEPFMVLWCDLILSDSFSIPDATGNYIGISKDFECRWSYIDDKCVKKPSKEDGIAGLFIFENKKVLEGIPQDGALVSWLGEKGIKFQRLDLYGSKEIGTLLSYADHTSRGPRCRPFNSMEYEGDKVIKRGITEQGRKIAVDEIAWYKHVRDLGYSNIPLIYGYEPLTMKRVKGRNIYEYDTLDTEQKQGILKGIIKALKELHALEPPQEASIPDCEENYITKTFDRLSQVQSLIPFAGSEHIVVNGRRCRNVFFLKDELTERVKGIYPKEFRLIHGDCTFSNMMFDTFDMQAVLIDPRGYFGKTKLYGDVDYDWAKLYYSLKGDYDQFNLKRFSLDINDSDVVLHINSNNWSDMEELFFESIKDDSGSEFKIRLLHAIIWLSLTTYAWDDYDSICGAFYNGVYKLSEALGA